MYMNLNSNLKFDEVMLRYVIMMALGITGGVLHNYWFIIPVMLVFLTAVLGWSPVKAYMQQRREHRVKEENIVLTHRHAH